MTTTPTYPQLAAAVRSQVEAIWHWGAHQRWRPTPGSDADNRWERAAEGGADALERTLAEAEASASLLAQSALEHARALAAALSKSVPAVPHSLARTVHEHALRSIQLLDVEISGAERARRRLLEWAYAVQESRRYRDGTIEHGHPGAAESPDPAEAEARVRDRAQQLGLEATTGRHGLKLDGVERLSTLQLGELYLAGNGGGGVPSATQRVMAGMGHGLETGLLRGSSTDDVRGGLREPRLAPMPAELLAFELQGVPLVLSNLVQQLALRFDWPGTRRGAECLRACNRAIDVWLRGVTAHLDDVAPHRERTGLVSRRDLRRVD